MMYKYVVVSYSTVWGKRVTYCESKKECKEICKSLKNTETISDVKVYKINYEVIK